MAKQQADRSPYLVSIQDEPHHPDALRFTFVSQGLQPVRVPVDRLETVPRYAATVEGHGDKTRVTWLVAPDDEDVKGELEGVARKRVTARYEWLEKLRKLIDTVKGWSGELGWSTKVVEKRMEDREIGAYRAPALLLQEEAVKLFLEPVSRASPGADGVVDLYVMPSYDDIATFYHSGNTWNIHHPFQGDPEAGTVGKTEAKPLTKATLRSVFDELTHHAG